ncbi:Rapid ALkalinization Factor [Dillenia turbinata]|uniref:Rapid ALkalinization Factor n=1 Tax=Dillenia turbinata TaxID=194707 RepID=A0AAN8YUD0_9MAGN
MRRTGDSLALMAMIFLVYALNVSAAVMASVAISSDRKWECNGTIGECFIGEQLEMLMDSEISRRQLESTNPTTNALNPGQAVCGREPYASCLPNEQKNVNRGCSAYDGCRLVVTHEDGLGNFHKNKESNPNSMSGHTLTTIFLLCFFIFL